MRIALVNAMTFPFVRASSLKYLHPFRTEVREVYDQFCMLALKLL